MTDDNFNDRSKWPTDLGESFELEYGTPKQMQQGGAAAPQQGGQTIPVAGAEEAAVEIPVVAVKLAAPHPDQQPGTWDDWHISSDMG
ncbi:MAG: hypothetical protein KA099_07005 [Alphaproteobacteria bacterium]|nr:hypothetical protein [Alphaproteobacteria bacterium]MBP7759692.1 hypothetical protein [Alphaproteobacteria bacterium]MBP7762859.1 hypothetical protein [Alphaproteobacteria bacterium]MBP7905058.1 hypothetical protein [Alphaproteobacteria bacterium]